MTRGRCAVYCVVRRSEPSDAFIWVAVVVCTVCLCAQLEAGANRQALLITALTLDCLASQHASVRVPTADCLPLLDGANVYYFIHDSVLGRRD